MRRKVLEEPLTLIRNVMVSMLTDHENQLGKPIKAAQIKVLRISVRI